MKAILLAAGRGQSPRQGDHPKCLLEVAGKASLLEQHFACTARGRGSRALPIVVGHPTGPDPHDVGTPRLPPCPVEFVVNPQYLFGSLVSLQVSGAEL